MEALLDAHGARTLRERRARAETQRELLRQLDLLSAAAELGVLGAEAVSRRQVGEPLH